MKIIRSFTVLVFTFALVSIVVPGTFAQSDSKVAVSVVAGAASGASDSGLMLGGSVLVDLDEHFSVEGQISHLDRGRGAHFLSVSGSLPINLLPSTERAIPYAVVGGGLNRASFDLATPRFLGLAGVQFAAGSRLCPAPGIGFGFGPGPGLGSGSACPADAAGYWGVGELHLFYARRLGVLIFPRGDVWRTRSFTDPALNVGGGLRVHVTDRLMLRPDIRALVILGGGRTHTLGLFSVHAGYRF